MRGTRTNPFARADEQAYRTPTDPRPTGAKSVRVLSKDDERAVSLADVVAELRLMRETSTAAAARATAGGIVNDVLEVSTRKFDASGVMVLDYNVAVGSAMITNPAGTQVTYQAGTQTSDTAPTVGNGVQVVPAVSWLAVPVAAHSFSLYGTPGAQVSLQVFTGMTAFGITR